APFIYAGGFPGDGDGRDAGGTGTNSSPIDAIVDADGSCAALGSIAGGASCTLIVQYSPTAYVSSSIQETLNFDYDNGTGNVSVQTSIAQVDITTSVRQPELAVSAPVDLGNDAPDTRNEWINQDNYTAYPVSGTCWPDTVVGAGTDDVQIAVRDRLGATKSFSTNCTGGSYSTTLDLSPNCSVGPGLPIGCLQDSALDGSFDAFWDFNIIVSHVDELGNAPVENPIGGVNGFQLRKDVGIPSVNNVRAVAVSTNPHGVDQYNAGKIIDIYVEWDEKVYVAGGVPNITLENQTGTNPVVNYTSGSGSPTLTFRYTVSAGENSTALEYVNTSSLNLNGATIQDQAANDGIPTLPVIGPGGSGFNSISDNATFIIDTVAPVVSSVDAIEPTPTDGFYTNPEVIAIRVKMSEAVIVNAGTPEITLNMTGPNADVAVPYSSISADNQTLTFNYTISDGDNNADLDYENTTAFSVGDIEDFATNDATRTLAAPGAVNSISDNQAVAVDTKEPLVTEVTSPTGTGFYKAGEEVDITVVWDEIVNVSGTPQITLNMAGPNADIAVNYTSGSGSDTLTFRYTVLTGDNTNDLDYEDTNALVLNGGDIEDRATNDAVVAGALAVPNAVNSISDDLAIVIDTIPATVDEVTTNKNDGFYTTGEVIDIIVDFSEDVFVTGSPLITLENSLGGRPVTYTSGSGTELITFNYTVVFGDMSTDLDYQAVNSLVLNSGTLNDIADNPSTLTLDTPLTGANSMGVDHAIVIDTAPPEIVEVRADKFNGFYKAGELIPIEMVITESVTVSGTPTLTLENQSGADVVVNYSSGSGTDTLTFNYTVSAGEDNTDLDYIAVLPISFNGGNISDASTNQLDLTTIAAPFAVNSISDNQDIAIDTTVPTLSTVSIYSNNANPVFAKVGDIVTLSFSADEPLLSDPTVLIDGNVAVVAGATPNYTATYTMQAGDTEGVLAYTIDFLDRASNPGVQVSAPTDASTVTFDETAPLAPAVNISSNGLNNNYAKVGDIVTVSFTVDDTLLATPTVTIDGNSAVVSGTNPNYTAAYTMQAGDTEAVLGFTLDFTDKAGNPALQVVATTDASSVTFDETIPTASPRSIYSDNINTSRAKVNDDVILSFTVSEVLHSDPTVTIDGNTATINNASAPAYTGAYTMQAGDTEGVLAYTIDFIDLAGNVNTTYTTVTDATTVVFDETPPTAPAISIFSNNAATNLAKVGDIVTLSFTVDEPLLGNPTVTIDTQPATLGGAYPNYTASYTLVGGENEGVLAFTVDFTDAVGNPAVQVTATTDLSTVTFDETPPQLSAVLISSNNVNTSARAKVGDTVTISLTANETLIADPTVTIDGNTATINNAGAPTYGASYIMMASDTEGVLAYTLDFTDAAGNPGVQVTATTDASQVIFDETAPTLPLVTIFSNNGNPALAKVGDIVTLSFTVDEPLVSNPSVSIDGNTATIGGVAPNYTASYTMQAGDTEAILTYAIDFTDSVGNVGIQITSVTDATTVTFDETLPTAPAVTIFSNNADTALAKTGDIVTLSFTIDEPLLGNPTVTIGGNAATLGGAYPNYTASYTFVGGETEGILAYTLDFTDATGNNALQVTSTTDSTQVRFDETPPVANPVTIYSNNFNTARAKVGDDVIISFTVSETLLIDPTVTIDGNAATINNASAPSYTATYTMQASDTEGVLTYTLDFVDLAGNTATQVTATSDASQVVFDETAPLAPAVSIFSNNANTSLAKVGDIVTLSFTIDEPLLGNPTVVIDGKATTLAGSYPNFTASYTFVGGETEAALGFTLNFTDAVGNPGLQVTAVTDGTSVTFDETLPTAPVVTIYSNNANSVRAKVGDDVILSFTVDEPLLGSPTVTIDGNATVIGGVHPNYTATYTMAGSDTEGILTYTLDFDDSAGNSATQVTATTDSSQVIFDETAPTSNPVTIYSNNSNTAIAKVGDTVTLSFTVDEPLLGSPTVTIDGNATTIGGTHPSYTADYTLVGGETEGSLAFTLDFTDAVGNPAVQVTATSDSSTVIFDNTPPTAPGVTIFSNNANTALAKVGDIVTLSFTVDEPLLTTPTVTIDGNAAVVAGTNPNYTATYTMQALDTEGVLAFTLDFQDNSGNQAVQVTGVTDATSVTFDETAPLSLARSIFSNNANTARAKVGDIVTLSFTVNEPLLGSPSVSIDGNTATIGGAYPSYTASYTMAASDTEGVLTYAIDFNDAAGNPNATYTTVTDASQVIFDETAPMANPVTIYSDNVNTALAKVGDTVTLSFTVDEPLLGNPTVTIDSQATTLGGAYPSYTASYTFVGGETDGVLAFTLDFTDNVGNPATQVIAVTDGTSVTFDETVPTLAPVTIASSNANSGRALVGDVVTITFTASENLIRDPTVTIDGNAATINNVAAPVYQASYTMQASDTEGILAFTIDFVDTASNPGVQVTATTNFSQVIFDETAPQAPAVSIFSNNGNPALAKVGDIVTLSFTVDEPLLGSPTVTIDGNGATIGGAYPSYTATYTMQTGDSQGALGFTLDFTDAVGNPAIQVTAVSDASSVTFDETAPTSTPRSIYSNNANLARAKVGDDVIISFTVSEALLGSPTVTIDGNATVIGGTHPNYTATYTMQASDSEGILTYTIDFDDAAGNSAVQLTTVTDGTTVTFDETAPTSNPVTIYSNNSTSTTIAKVGDTVTLSFTVDEPLLGSPTVTIDGNATTLGGTHPSYTADYTLVGGETEGSLAFTLDFTDAVGNPATQVIATSDSSSVVFDSTAPLAPAVTIFSNNADTTLAKVGDIVTLSFTVNEPLLGSPTVTIDGNATTIGGSYPSYTAAYTMVGGEAEGNLGFTLDFTDLSGNPAIQVTATSDASQVRFDETDPTATPRTIFSNNANTARAKVGDDVTISFTVSETLLADPTVTIDGNTATINSAGAPSYTATYTMQASDTEGVLAYSIDFIDLAGNTNTTYTTVTDASQVVFDETAPMANPVTIYSNNGNTALAKVGDIVTLSFTVNEPLLGNPTVTIDSQATTLGGAYPSYTASYTFVGGETDGVLAFTLDFTDNVGNPATQVVAVTDATSVTFDEVVPTATPVTISSNNSNSARAKVGDVVTLSFTVNEALLGSPTVTIDGNATTIGGAHPSYTASYTMVGGETQGVLGFTLDFDDAAGNSAVQVTATSDASQVIFDETAPQAPAVSIFSSNGNPALAKVGDIVTLSFTVDEPLLGSPTVTIDGNGATIGGAYPSYTATYTMQTGDSQGALGFTLDFTDAVGNPGIQVTAVSDASSVTFDETAPTSTPRSIYSNNANLARAKVGDDVIISFTVSEALLGSPTVTIDGNATVIAGTHPNYTATYTMQASDTEGILTYTIDFDDAAGNSAIQLTTVTDGTTVTFDETLPTALGVTIFSDNLNTAKAQVGDVVTVSFTVDEPLLGNPTVTIDGNATTLGGAYPSFTASYTIVGGETEGSLAFTLDFTDAVGNPATQVTATSDASQVVFDETAPLASAVSIFSNNGNTSLAKVGDIVTLSFTVNEPLLGSPTVTIDGNATTIGGTYPSYTATYTMVGGESEAVLGFTLDFTDASGNPAIQVVAVSDATSVTFDETAPLSAARSIFSNNGNAALAKVGDIVTVSFTVNETLLGSPTVTIDGNSSTISGTHPNYTATYTMQASDTTGIIAYTIDFDDAAGNSAIQLTTVTDATTVTFDETAPTSSPRSIYSNNLNPALAAVGDVVTLSFTVDEPLLGNPTVTIDGNATTLAGAYPSYTASYTMAGGDTTGVLAYTIDFDDAAGNSAIQLTTVTDGSTVTFDETLPTLAPVTIASNNAINSDWAKVGDTVTITFTASETLLNDPTVTIDGNAATINNVAAPTYLASYIMQTGDTEAALTYTIDFEDTSGNNGVQVTATTNFSTVTFDETVPTSTPRTIASNNIDPAQAVAGDIVTLSFTVNEVLAANPTVTIDGNAATIGGTGPNYTGAYTFLGPETEAVVAYTIDFMDRAGNTSVQYTTVTNGSTVTYSNTPPTLNPVAIYSNNGNTALAKVGDIVTLSFTSDQSLLSDPTVTIDGNTATVNNASAPSYTASYTMQAGDNDGVLAFTIDYVSLGGLSGTQVTSTSDSSTVTFDEVDPLATPVTIYSNNANTARAKVGDIVTLSFTVNEPLLGSPTVTIDGNGATIGGAYPSYTASYTFVGGENDGVLAFTLDFDDATGNSATQVVAVTDASSVTFDEVLPTAPAVSIYSNNANPVIAKVGDIVTVSFTVDEPLLGNPTVTIDSQATTIGGAYPNYTASYTLVGGENEGALAFTLDFTDATGNTAVQVTSTSDASSVTFDETVPTSPARSIFSNNANPALAKVGDIVTLSFTVNEPLLGSPTVTIDSKATTIGGAYPSYTASYTFVGGETEAVLGFTLDFTDASGNPGVQVTSVTDATSVTFDETDPLATPVTIYSNNANPALAKVGDIVTLSFTVNEPLLGSPTVTIDGNATTLGGAYPSYTASYTFVGGENDGVLAFTLDFDDATGNSATQVTATSDATSVTFDEVLPTAPAVSIFSNNANPAIAKVGDVVTLSFTVDEPLLGNPTVTIDTQATTLGGAYPNYTASYTMVGGENEGALAFTLNFDDAAGNSGVQVTATSDSSSVTFDETAPLASAVTIYSNNANTALAKVGDIVTLSFTVNEPLLGSPTVTIDGKATTIGGAYPSYTASYTFVGGETEAVMTFALDFTDAGGNAGVQVTAVTDATSVTFDETLPTSSPRSIYSNNANSSLAKVGDIVTVSFTVNEPLLGNPTVTIDGNATTLGGSYPSYTATYTMAGGETEAVLSYTIDFDDATGNSATQYTTVTDASTVTFDETKPSAGPVIIGSNNVDPEVANVGDDVTISFTVSEPLLADPSVTIDGNVATIGAAYPNYTATYTMQSGDNEGVLAYTVDFIDAAGNVANQITTTTDLSAVVFDETPPTANPVAIYSNNFNTALAKVGDIVTLSFTVNEPLTGNPTATIDGRATTLGGAYPSYTASYTFVGGETQGVLGFTIDFVDANGIAGVQVVGTSDASTVTFDETVPTSPARSIYSNNANPALAKVGDTVTLSFTVNEPLLGSPTVTIDGNAATIGGAYPSYSASYTLVGGETESALGFTLDFTDASGNPGVQVTSVTDATSVTFDETDPLTSAVTIYSNNANTALAKVGDIVTLSFSVDEPLLGNPTVTIDGNATTLGGSYPAYTASYTFVGGENDGVLAFTLDFDDAAGNSATQVTATSDATTVTFDEVLPTAPAVSIFSNNANPAIAKVGDVVTLSFTVDEPLLGNPTVTIDSKATTIAGSYPSYTASYTMVGGETESSLAFTLDFDDAAGNSAVQVTATSDASTVTFDETAPLASAVTIYSNNANTALAKVGDIVTLSFTVNEPLLGSPTVTIDGNATSIGGAYPSYTASYTLVGGESEAALGFTLDFTDASGNAAVQVTAVTDATSVTFDETAPLAPAVTIYSDNANTALAKVGDVVTLSFTVNEPLLGNPTVTIDSQGATIGGAYPSYTASYTLVGGESEAALGFTLNFTDAAGNPAVQVTAVSDATSVTFDETAPLAAPVTIYSNNANTAKAKVGDVVTLSFTVNEPLLGNPTVTIDGNATTLGGAYPSYTADYTIQTGDTAGILAFTLDFTDATGNAAAQVTATSDASSVEFDEIAPLATAVTIFSNNGNTARAKVGDVVTLSFTVNEPLLGNPTATIDGNAATIGGAYPSYTATYTMQTGDNQGALGFTLDFTDAFGNPAVQVTAVTDASSVTFDETAPLASAVTIFSNNANTALAKVGDVVTLSFTVNEPLLGNPTVTIDSQAATIGGAYPSYTASYTFVGGENDGALSFTLDFTDAVGNPAVQVSAVTDASSVTFDEVLPTAPAVTIYSNNANTALAKVGDIVTLSFSVDEPLLGSPTVTIDSQAATIGGSYPAYTASYTFVGGENDGVLAFTLDFDDATGNSATQVTATSDATSVTFDEVLPTAPAVSIFSNNANPAIAKVGDVVTLSFTVDEPLLGNPTVTIDSKATTIAGSYPSYTASYTMVGGETESSLAFTLDFDDAAGNSAVQVTATSDASTVTFDETAPLASAVTIYSNNANTALAKVGDIVTLSFTVNEPLLGSPTVTIDGNATSIGGAYPSYTASYTLVGGESEAALGFTLDFTDASGNAAVQVTAVTDATSVTFDETAPLAPAVTIYSDNANTALAKVGDVVTLSFTVNEPLLGNPTVTIDSQGATIGGAYPSYTASYTLVGGESEAALGFTLNFTDAAGNPAVQVTAVSDATSVTFDETAPLAAPVTIYSNNANTALAKVGDVVTLSFTVNEPLLGNPTVTIDSQATTLAGSYPNYTASYTFTGGENDGVLAFTLDFTDATGNAASQVTATSDATSVTFDETIPLASAVTIFSNNANTAKAKVGDIVTLSFTVNEPLLGNPTVTIDGNSTTLSGTYPSYTAAYTMQTGDTEAALGFTLDFTDASGNPAVQVTAVTDATSVTFDETAPLASAVTIFSNNANTARAKVGDVVTLSFTVNEPLLGNPTVAIDSQAATIGGAYPSYTASYTLVGGESEAALGFTLNFTDATGNPAVQVTAVSDATSVIFDETAPLAAPVTIYSNNANTALAKVGDIVTLSFTVNEPLLGNPTVTIDSQTATIGGSYPAYTASYTMAGGETTGVLGFTLDFTDVVGNAATQVIAVTDATSVTFDETPPLATPVSISSNNATTTSAKVGDIVTLSFTVNEPLLGNPTVTIDGKAASIIGSYPNYGATYTMQTGDTAVVALGFTLDFTDAVGNPAIQVVAVTDASQVIFDETAPTATSVSIASNNADTTAAKIGDIITVSFTVDDNVDATPTATIQTKAATVAVAGAHPNYTATYTMTGTDTEGAVAFTLDFSDEAGNAATQVTAVTDATSVTFDRTVPTATAVSIASNNATTTVAKSGDEITVSFTVSDNVDAMPTATIQTKAATVAVAGAHPNYTAKYTMIGTDTEGAVAFTIDFNDEAGNAATQVTAVTDATSVTYDRTAPTATTVSIASNNANALWAKTGDEITVSFTVDDDMLATPTATIQTKAATVAVAGAHPNYTAKYTMIGTDTEGAIAFTIDFSDEAGNAATQVTAVTDATSVTFDRTAPVLQYVTSTLANGAYNDPNVIPVQIHYDSDMVVAGGTPVITLEVGAPDAAISYTGTTAETLSFSYTIADGDDSSDLTYNDGEAINLAGATITDLAGNAPASFVLPNNTGALGDSLGDRKNIEVDTTHPTIAVTTPANSSYIFEGNDSTTFSVTGTCSEPTQNVTVVANGGDVTTAQVTQCDGANFSVTFDSTALANNTVHTIAAKVTDAAGNSTTSGTNSVTRDVTDPTLAVTTPTTGAYFNENTDSATYSVLGTCSENLQNVTVLIDAGAVTTAQVAQCNGTNFSVTFDSTALANNTTFTLAVRMSDVAGNSNDSATISVTRDITKPAAPTGLTVTYGTNSNSIIPSFTWTESTDPNKAGQEVGLDAAAPGGNSEDGWDPIAEGTATASFPTVNSAPLSECTDYYPSVRTYDDAGNVSTITAGQPIKIDTVATTGDPVFTQGTDATPSFTPTITMTTAATDACGIHHYEIRVSHDNGDGGGTAADQILDAGEQGNLFNWYSIGDGTDFPKKVGGQSFLPGNYYFYEIRGVDWGGNVTGIFESAAFEVEVSVVGNFQTGTTHTPTTGSNRYLFFFASFDIDNDAGADMTAVTYGGQAMTQATEVDINGNCCGWDTRVEIWMLDEAGIAAAEALPGTTFVPTYDFPGRVRPNYSSLMLEGVSQVSAIYSTASGLANNGNSFTTSSLNELKKGITLMAAGHGNPNVNITFPGGFTTSANLTDASNQTTHRAGYELPAVDGSRTFNVTADSTFRFGACAVHIAP
ncbi:MAG: hypothetical protein ACJAYQ_002921, partial [Bacteriovoracaceae bacterium]